MDTEIIGSLFKPVNQINLSFISPEFLRRALDQKMDHRVLAFVCERTGEKNHVCWMRLSAYLPMIQNGPVIDLIEVLKAVLPDTHNFAEYRRRFLLFFLADRHYADWLASHEVPFSSEYRLDRRHVGIGLDENAVTIALTRAIQNVWFINHADNQDLATGNVYGYDKRHQTSVRIERTFLTFQQNAPAVIPYFNRLITATAMTVKPEDAPTFTAQSGVTA